jgi:hypothetical protein
MRWLAQEAYLSRRTVVIHQSIAEISFSEISISITLFPKILSFAMAAINHHFKIVHATHGLLFARG